MICGGKDLPKRQVLILEWKSEGVMDRESGEEDGKHEEVRLVHKVKMEVYFRDEVRHTEKSDL